MSAAHSNIFLVEHVVVKEAYSNISIKQDPTSLNQSAITENRYQ